MQAIAIGDSGEAHVPVLGRKAGPGPASKRFFSGVVSAAPGGSVRTTFFEPAVEVRRMAVDSQGNLYAFGLDPEYLRSISDLCLLVHKYAPDGRRITAFSGCPGNEGHRARPGATPTQNPHFQRLKLETDRGQVQIDGGSVYHVLPLSWRIRVFDLNGKMLREVSLSPPPEDQVLSSPFALSGPVDERWVQGVYPLADERFLVHWHLRIGTHRRPYYAVHDGGGKAVSRASQMYRAGPFQADGLGNVYLAREAAGAAGAVDLMLARITVE